MDNSSVLPHGYVLHGEKQSYVIDRKLGQGSFGITYLAKFKAQVTGQMGSGNVWMQVCVKEFFMRDMNSRDEQSMVLRDATGNSLVMKYRRAFMREAHNLARMKHPGIVNVFEVIETNNTAYIVMEYIDGGSLDEYIAQRGRLPETEALACFEPVCDAMCYMHAQRMLHLDMKPKNVMRDEEGHLYLIDFGLSKQYTEDGKPETSTTIGMGTPGYAPIEQAEQRDESKDFRTSLDVYALGGTLYKMLTGQTPPTASEVNNAVLNGENLIQNELRQVGVSPQVAKVVSTAMWPGTKKRYQTVPELMGALGWTAKTYQMGARNAHEQASEVAPVDEETELTANEETELTTQPQPQPTPKPRPQPKPQPDERSSKMRLVKMSMIGALAVGLVILSSVLLLKRCSRENSQLEESIGEVMPSDSVVGDSAANAFEEEIETIGLLSSDKESGSVKVNSTPNGATIWVDGKSTGLTTNDVIEELEIGSHKVKVQLEGYESQMKTVTVKAGERVALSFTLKEVQPYSATLDSGSDESTKPNKKANSEELSDIYDLGTSYFYGIGVSQNYETSVEYFRKAAEQGHAEAQWSLGLCYFEGTGVKQNYETAVYWYRKSAEQGFVPAQFYLGNCYYSGYGIAENHVTAIEWFRKAAVQDYSDAQFNLGLCYFNGDGVAQNYKTAVEWFRRAAEHGDAEAQYNLGSCYLRGNGVAQSYETAAEWFRKAAEQGDVDAQFNLGSFYYNGDGVTQNYETAVEWFRKAAARGDADAQFALGKCYEYGNGVEENLSTAKEWYQKSAKQGFEKAISACKRLEMSYE